MKLTAPVRKKAKRYYRIYEKVNHFPKGVGINLDKYPNISKENLATLQNIDGGLVPYVQKDGKLPTCRAY